MGLLFSAVKPAYAETTYTGGTFTYGGLTYPDSLYGVTVTINTNPTAPNSYLGNSGGPLMWNSGTWYPIGALTPTGIADYWLSESSAVNNPWYCAWNTTNSTTMTNAGNYFDANHGWGTNTASKRTITFGHGADASLPLGSHAYETTLKLLYHHDFIRYIVDNSDFRTRYTFQTTPTIGNISASVGWFGTTSVTMQFGIRVVAYAPYPSSMQFWYSQDASTWQLLGTLTSPTASSSDIAQWFWTTTRSGYFMVKAFMPNASSPVWTWTSENVTYDEDDNPSSGGSGSGSGDSGDSDVGDIVQSAIDTLRSIYNGFSSFFNGLLGWLPTDLRNFFVAIVVCSLVVGLFRIIRGS